MDDERKAVVGWTLYDLANTIFSFNILSFYFPVWAQEELGANDLQLSIAFSVSMAVVAIASPIMGSLSDRAGTRLPFLMATTVGCVVLTALLGTGGLVVALVFYAVANLLFQLGLVFYDALLPEVSDPETVGGVGGAGIGIGYVGSFIGLGTGALLLSQLDTPHPWIFAATGGLFLLFALPCFLFVQESPTPREGRASIADTIRGLRETARDVVEIPSLGRFLLARFTYTDAANTMIIFLGIYTTQELGFSERVGQFVLGAGILSAVIGGFLFGYLVDRKGAKPVLMTVLGLWVASLSLAAAVPLLALPTGLFWVAACGAGMALGGTWASDRPLMLELTPPDRVGEFYGLYGMVGRFAAVVGPLGWGVIVDTLGWGRPTAVLTLVGAIVVAAGILAGVQPGQTLEPSA